MRAIINPDAVKVGDHLRSKPIGMRASFVGEVMEVNAERVILRDAERRRYVRD